MALITWPACFLCTYKKGCTEFFEHYFDQKTGYGLWTPRWGGNDGPDDGAEGVLSLFAILKHKAKEANGGQSLIQIWSHATM